MKRLLLFLPLTVLLLQNIYAQSYYNVTHVTGTKTVGTIPITVRPTGFGTNTVTNCFGPYRIGEFRDTSSSYIYNFGLPVTTVRLQLTNIGYYELIGIDINGNFYPINNSHLSASICGPSVCVPYGGFIGGVLNANSFAQVDLHPGYFIDSIRVFYKLKDTIDQGGINYGFYYATDPHVFVHKPVIDTSFCAADSMDIRYDLSDIFDTAANVFSVQLSDASGNFSNGTIIGSAKKYGAGAITCHIPASMPPGTGYRYRIIASKPADTSADNGKNIRITPYPVVDAHSNSPVCIGKPLSLTSTASDYDSLKWFGPNGFTSTTPNLSFISSLEIAGKYSVNVSKNGCTVTKVLNIDVKPVPFIKSIKNNSPICQGEILKITASANDTGAVFSWSGPAGFYSSVPSPSINDAPDSISGFYKAFVSQLGCVSEMDSTFVLVKPKPNVYDIKANSPLEPAQDLHLTISGTQGSTYSWTGPDGFTSTEQNPTVPEVGDESEGIYNVAAALNGCMSAASIDVKVLENALHYKITPNPSDGDITITGNYRINKTTPVRIVNSAGQTVYSQVLSTPTKFLNLKLDTKGMFSNGLYFLKLTLKNKETLNLRLLIKQ